MNATAELNEPYRRNDANTTHAVMSHIDSRYPGEFGEVHYRACVREALIANDATVGCEIADNIAATLRRVRERFVGERNLRATL